MDNHWNSKASSGWLKEFSYIETIVLGEAHFLSYIGFMNYDGFYLPFKSDSNDDIPIETNKIVSKCTTIQLVFKINFCKQFFYSNHEII